MANAREIQSRMKSIRDTMKITNAMYMISSSKLKKAKMSLTDTEPYFYTLQSAIVRILRHFPEIDCAYFKNTKNEDLNKKKGYIVVTADKGLAGSYNHNIFKMVEERINEKDECKLFVVGEMGRHYFKKREVKVSQHFHYTVQNPTMSRARSIGEKVLEQYLSGKLDEVHIIYTRMINAMKTEAECLQLLPLEKIDYEIPLSINVPMEHIAMLPSPEGLIDILAPNCINGIIYGALVESYASEHNQRMQAMDAATKSAEDMLGNLSIEYNRVRQAAITQEITEVVSGAKAQKKKKKI